MVVYGLTGFGTGWYRFGMVMDGTGLCSRNGLGHSCGLVYAVGRFVWFMTVGLTFGLTVGFENGFDNFCVFGGGGLLAGCELAFEVVLCSYNRCLAYVLWLRFEYFTIFS